jgi:glycine betaine/proline transport system permease protein
MFEDKMIPLDDWVTSLVDWLVENHREFFQLLKWPVDKTLTGLDMGLNALSPLLVILAIALLAWRFSGKGLAVTAGLSIVLLAMVLDRVTQSMAGKSNNRQ